MWVNSLSLPGAACLRVPCAGAGATALGKLQGRITAGQFPKGKAAKGAAAKRCRNTESSKTDRYSSGEAGGVCQKEGEEKGLYSDLAHFSCSPKLSFLLFHLLLLLSKS